jgi:very-short-patch-repair endonuclease
MIDTPTTLICRIDAIGILRPTPEFQFDDVRKWRFDFAWPDVRIAIEIEGGISDRRPGRHMRARGYQDDLDKYNTGASYGWRIFRFSSKDIQENRPVFIASMEYCKSIVLANYQFQRAMTR